MIFEDYDIVRAYTNYKLQINKTTNSAGGYYVETITDLMRLCVGHSGFGR